MSLIFLSFDLPFPFATIVESNVRDVVNLVNNACQILLRLRILSMKFVSDTVPSCV